MHISTKYNVTFATKGGEVLIPTPLLPVAATLNRAISIVTKSTLHGRKNKLGGIGMPRRQISVI